MAFGLHWEFCLSKKHRTGRGHEQTNDHMYIRVYVSSGSSGIPGLATFI